MKYPALTDIPALVGAKPAIPDQDIDARRAWLLRQGEVQAQRFAAIIATLDLPALTGSDKQVAWADHLRCQYLYRQAQVVHQATKNIGRPATQVAADYEANIAQIWAALANTDARYWIDTRPITAAEIYWVSRINQSVGGPGR